MRLLANAFLGKTTTVYRMSAELSPTGRTPGGPKIASVALGPAAARFRPT